MNILDLKKGDKVYGLLEWNSSSVPIGVKYAEVMRVRKMTLSNNGLDIVLNYRDEAIIRATSLADGKIYASISNCMDQENAYELNESIFEMLGCTLHQITNEPFVWEWNKETKEAKSSILRYYRIDLFNPKLPDGCYSTKEECEKANRKMVTIEVTRTYLTEREEGEDAEWLLNHPDEYEWSDDDECISDAKYYD